LLSNDTDEVRKKIKREKKPGELKTTQFYEAEAGLKEVSTSQHTWRLPLQPDALLFGQIPSRGIISSQNTLTNTGKDELIHEGLLKKRHVSLKSRVKRRKIMAG
jgi:hypothetical protein